MRDIEQAILKKCLYSYDHLSQIMKLGCIFHFPEHIELYNILQTAYSENRPMDILLLSDMIQKENPKHLSVSYIEEMRASATDSVFDEYVKQVFDIYMRNLMEHELRHSGGKDPQQMIADLSSKMLHLTTSNTIITSKEYAMKKSEEITSGVVKTDEFIKCGTGYFDRGAGGRAKSDLIIWVARPGCGKTSQMISEVEFVSRKHPVGIFSMEETAKSIYDKMVCNMCQIDTRKMRKNDLTEAEKAKALMALSDIYERKIILDEEPRLYGEDIFLRAVRMYEKYGIGALYIDYLQYMQSHDRNKAKHEIIENHCIELKAIAKKLKIPVIALAQGDRILDTPDYTPKLKDVYGGSGIEKNADVMQFFIPKIRDIGDSTDYEFDHETTIAKDRTGPVGVVHRLWQKNYARITDYQ